MPDNPTATVLIGKNCLVTIGTGGAVLGQRSCTISVTHDMIETTVKGDATNGAAKTFVPGYYGWEVQVSGAYYVGTGGSGANMSTAIAGTSCSVSCAVGTETWSGSGYISSISVNGEYTDLATYDLTIQGSGPFGASS